MDFNKKEWEYEFENWTERFGSEPIELIASIDYSESYETEKMHIFKLKNGKYVSVYECGCSCYDYRDAQIDIYPNALSALEKYDVYVLEKKKNRMEERFKYG